MSNKVIVRCKPAILDSITDSHLEWDYSQQHGENEIDVIVNDVPYIVQDGYYQDPDEQLCEYYGINYNLVNCIEAA